MCKYFATILICELAVLQDDKKPDKNRIHKSHWYNMSTSTCCIDRFI